MAFLGWCEAQPGNEPAPRPFPILAARVGVGQHVVERLNDCFGIEVSCHDSLDRCLVQPAINQRLRQHPNTNTNLLNLLSLLMILIRRNGVVLRHWNGIEEARN